MNGMEQFEILKRVEPKLIRVTVRIDGKDTKMAQQVNARPVIIPGFTTAGFFVHNALGNWRCSESRGGLLLGYPAKTATKAVANAIEMLWKHCHGNEEEFNKVVEKEPAVINLPRWEPEEES